MLTYLPDEPDVPPWELGYREKWLAAYADKIKRPIRYNDYRKGEIGDTMLQEIEREFGSRSVPAWMPEHYRARLGDYMQLRRVLIALCCYRPKGGFQEAFSCFVTLILPFVGNERESFKLVAAVYDRFELEDYYAIQRRGEKLLEKDVKNTLADMNYLFPAAVTLFRREGEPGALEAWISRFLASLLACGFNSKTTSLEQYVELLDKLLSYTHASPRDPRKGLRWVVCCVVAMNAPSLLMHDAGPDGCAGGGAFLPAPIVISDELLSILASEFDLDSWRSLQSLAQARQGLAAGSATGLLPLQGLPPDSTSIESAVNLGAVVVDTSRANAAFLFQ
eukprot:TRINITY_DN27345_c0_g1_i1.p1 TRINITY_DN27345_c0_g1~~TRINITY_DN27345_c0_g1_i1.p1  ORF type:complete len:335 (-),score=40.42 TRINITY_DN27345_c0_g1_i1:490-1494(-)